MGLAVAMVDSEENDDSKNNSGGDGSFGVKIFCKFAFGFLGHSESISDIPTKFFRRGFGK